MIDTFLSPSNSGIHNDSVPFPLHVYVWGSVFLCGLHSCCYVVFTDI